jgi:hypothetical protein
MIPPCFTYHQLIRHVPYSRQDAVSYQMKRVGLCTCHRARLVNFLKHGTSRDKPCLVNHCVEGCRCVYRRRCWSVLFAQWARTCWKSAIMRLRKAPCRHAFSCWRSLSSSWTDSLVAHASQFAQYTLSYTHSMGTYHQERAEALRWWFPQLKHHCDSSSRRF